MTPQTFIAKWRRVHLTERSTCQQHFLDLCELLGQPKPAEADPDGAWYTFERGVRKTGGGRGWADVWRRGHFGWEYKGRHRDLATAYEQLLRYREDLENPPLLVVCDMDRFEVHTNFTGTVKQVHAFDLEGLADPANLDVLHRLFADPQALRPQQTRIGITEAAAGTFGQLADGMRARGVAPPEAAHFLMKTLFCLFAEDIGLLAKDLFTTVLTRCRGDPARLSRLLRDLFDAMAGGGDFGADTIARFNGGLFDDAGVIDLRASEIERLIELGRYDWADVEPSIFGTLFERTLDPDKRAQIGAHYTGREDILTLVEPVLMAPLRREWDAVRRQCDGLWPEIQKAARKQRTPRGGKARKESAARRNHDRLIHDFVERLAHIRVLDPACGSGNFLYVAIHRLLDLEKEVIAFAADRGLALLPQVRPTQLHGIEINPYAQQLAQVVIWIGYLQWMRHNGFSPPRDPVLEPIESIRLMDAIVVRRPERGMNAAARSVAARNAAAGSAARTPEPTLVSEPPASSASSGSPASSEPPTPSEPPDSSGASMRGGFYLLTWTTYGSWLPGERRGFVSPVPDGKGGVTIHNVPGEPYDADMPALRARAARRQSEPSVVLSRAQAEACASAFREVCEKYALVIGAGAIMSTHVHLVVESPEAEGPRLLNLFKGVSARRLGQRFAPSGAGPRRRHWWTRHGSRRLLPNEKAVAAAVDYVLNQSSPLLVFDQGAMEPGMNAAARSAAVQGAAAWRQSEPAPSSEPPDSSGALPTEPDWPEADVIIGNPPFLGRGQMRSALGDSYVDDLQRAFHGRLPQGADLCCYWFEKARDMIARRKLRRAGLLATQGIRGGSNRHVLERIKKTGDLFFAVSDREWVLGGAAVHISMAGFDDGTETDRRLDGRSVHEINADLTAGADTTQARVLAANANLCFQGTISSGPFDISDAEAMEMFAARNPNGRSNADVVRPWMNASDVTGRPRRRWIIDFGAGMPVEEAAGYEQPFERLKATAKPVRDKTKYAPSDMYPFWQLWCPRAEMRRAISGNCAARQIVSPRVSKFRLFVWVDVNVLASDATLVFAREDDYFFGVLHSTVHERWARRTGTQLREATSGCRYTPTSCFETFPFPPLAGGIERDVNVAARTPAPEPPAASGPPASSASSGSAASSEPPDSSELPDSSEPPDSSGAHDPTRVTELRAHISAAAARLNRLRETWLNPTNPDGSPALSEAALKKRTLTNLYNDRPTWLELAHAELDRAVLAAYGWPEDWAERLQPRRDEKGRVDPILGVADPAVEEELLARLLALNRATAEG